MTEPRELRVVRTEPRPPGAAISLPETHANFDTNEQQRAAFPTIFRVPSAK